MFARLLPLLVSLTCLPAGLPAAPPLAPRPREVVPLPTDPTVKRLRSNLLWLDARRKQLEAMSGDHTRELANLKMVEEKWKRDIERIEHPPIQPERMPAFRADQLPGYRGAAPRPPVRD